MAISLYDATVASFIQTLGGVEGFLARGFDHCRDNNINPREIVETRLYADMFPFSFQVSSTVLHSLGALEACKTGVFSPAGAPDTDYTGLQKIVGEAKAKLQAMTHEEINALSGKDVVFKFRDRTIPFVAENFLLSFSLPNFYFHATTAYDILRIKGVPLGKRDFMGQLRMKA